MSYKTVFLIFFPLRLKFVNNNFVIKRKVTDHHDTSNFKEPLFSATGNKTKNKILILKSALLGIKNEVSVN